MKVEIKNDQLQPAIQLMYGLLLKGKQSRHRTKFINRLNDQLKEVMEQEKQLVLEYAKKDEDGNPIEGDRADTFIMDDRVSFIREQRELFEEGMVIDSTHDQVMLKTVKEILSQCEVEFSKQDAMTYDYLCDQFGVD